MNRFDFGEALRRMQSGRVVAFREYEDLAMNDWFCIIDDQLMINCTHRVEIGELGSFAPIIEIFTSEVISRQWYEVGGVELSNWRSDETESPRSE